MGMMGVIGRILPILPIISSHNSNPQNPDRLLQPRGDYQTLLSFQKAEIIYDITFRFVHKFLAKETRPPEVIANIAICLIHQTNYLIDQQLRRLERDFVKDGGLRERMTRARLAYRNRR
jgi:four helix bundle suffix protein